jgi:cell division septum initiation protein DivIVA
MKNREPLNRESDLKVLISKSVIEQIKSNIESLTEKTKLQLFNIETLHQNLAAKDSENQNLKSTLVSAQNQIHDLSEIHKRYQSTTLEKIANFRLSEGEDKRKLSLELYKEQLKTKKLDEENRILESKLKESLKCHLEINAVVAENIRLKSLFSFLGKDLEGKNYLDQIIGCTK